MKKEGNANGKEEKEEINFLDERGPVPRVQEQFLQTSVGSLFFRRKQSAELFFFPPQPPSPESRCIKGYIRFLIDRFSVFKPKGVTPHNGSQEEKEEEINFCESGEERFLPNFFYQPAQETRRVSFFPFAIGVSCGRMPGSVFAMPNQSLYTKCE
jgi:hypothetical protein